MTDITVLSFMQKALTIAAMVTLPVLGVSLTVGLTTSIVQAATQVQDMTVSFVPKVIATVAALVFFGPWILRTLVTFIQTVLTELPVYAR